MVESKSLEDNYDKENWRAQAACLDVPPGIFFPNGTTGVELEKIRRAKAICGRCAVNKACLDYALTTQQDAGIWGGTTEEERRSARVAVRRRSDTVG